MFHKNIHTRTAGMGGMFGAGLFFVGLLIEYQYALFPPGSGPLYIMNQVMFLVAMVCILVMVWGIRGMWVRGSGRFARIALTGFAAGWAALIAGGVASLVTGNADNLLFPVGGLMSMLFGLLAGIAVALDGKWSGWGRFALLLQGVYFLLVMMVLPIVFTGSNDPTLLTESLWMATWFLLGLALYTKGRRTVEVTAVAIGQL